jgi:hypothetical protein
LGNFLGEAKPTVLPLLLANEVSGKWSARVKMRSTMALLRYAHFTTAYPKPCSIGSGDGLDLNSNACWQPCRYPCDVAALNATIQGGDCEWSYHLRTLILRATVESKSKTTQKVDTMKQPDDNGVDARSHPPRSLPCRTVFEDTSEVIVPET